MFVLDSNDIVQCEDAQDRHCSKRQHTHSQPLHGQTYV